MRPIPEKLHPVLLPVAHRVFWWGDAQAWLKDTSRFVAQVMTCGDWNDTFLTLTALGEETFKQVLTNPPPGVFDPKSWTFWHCHYHLEVPPLPTRKL
jgi:hypothetical protein